MIRRKRRRQRRSARLEWFAFALFLSANALVYRAFSSHSRFAHLESVPVPEATFAALVRPAAEPRLSRPVYPYSVIRGGAGSIAELDAALSKDPVASAQYAGFHRDAMRMTNAPGPLLMYASYRMGGSVYWTSHPVHIAAGESLITDGTSLARARCGNQLSDSPREPVARMEPMAREMEMPEPPELNKAPAADARALTRLLPLRQPIAPPVSALVFEVFPHAPLSAAPASPGSPGIMPFQAAAYSAPGAWNPANSWFLSGPAFQSSLPLEYSPAAYSPASAGEPGESSLQLTLQTFQLKAAATNVLKIPQVSLPVLPGVIRGVEWFPGDDPLDLELPITGPAPPFTGPGPPATTTSRLPPVTGNPDPGQTLLTYGNPSESIPGTNFVPEPVAGALLGAGVALLYFTRRRRSL
jgi:hypothetical protein